MLWRKYKLYIMHACTRGHERPSHRQLVAIRCKEVQQHASKGREEDWWLVNTHTQHKIWLWQCFLRNKVFSACLWDLSAFWWMKLKQLTLITALKGFQDSYRQVTKYFKKPIPSNILYFNKKSMCKWLKEPIAVTGDIRPKCHHAEHSFTYLSPPSQPRCV